MIRIRLEARPLLFHFQLAEFRLRTIHRLGRNWNHPKVRFHAVFRCSDCYRKNRRRGWLAEDFRLLATSIPTSRLQAANTGQERLRCVDCARRPLVNVERFGRRPLLRACHRKWMWVPGGGRDTMDIIWSQERCTCWFSMSLWCRNPDVPPVYITSTF